MATASERYLVVGHRGMLGSAFMDLLARARVDGFDLPDLDVTSTASVEGMLDLLRPTTIINCSGFTRVDEAEEKRETAFAVNATGPAILARAASRRGVRLVHFSTDYVFDGRQTTPYDEEDTVHPLNIYGASKLEGERAVLADRTHLVLRTSWLFGPRGKNFVDTILRLAETRSELRVVADETGSPTYTFQLATTTLSAVAQKLSGLYHVAGKGRTNWADFARRILALRNQPTTVTPITAKEFGAPARRPSFSVLDVAKIERALGATLPDWEAGLGDYLSRYRRT